MFSNISFEGKSLTYAKRTGLRSMQNIKGFEREIIETYKSELTHDVWGNPGKLIEWVEKKFIELREKNYFSSKLTKDVVDSDRNDAVKAWADILSDNIICSKNPFLKLKILRSIVEDLKENNKQLTPVINKTIFEDAVYEVNKRGTSFKKVYFNLFKQFESIPALRVDDSCVNGIRGKWYNLKLPDNAQASLQPGLFRKIKEFLSVLSQGSNWCIRSTKSINNDFIGNNFHIFIDNKGRPQLCIVGSDKYGGRFRYIKGNDQYAKIPDKYKEVLKSFLKENNFENAVVGETDASLISVSDLCK